MKINIASSHIGEWSVSSRRYRWEGLYELVTGKECCMMGWTIVFKGTPVQYSFPPIAHDWMRDYVAHRCFTPISWTFLPCLEQDQELIDLVNEN